MDKTAVLIPCYNEGQTIVKVINDIKENLPDAVIYVYDNNSSDNTAELAKSAGAVVRYEPRQGKGNVIRRMFREIDAECYLMLDGDDTYPAEYADSMVKAVLEENADMVIGDRLSSTYYCENKRPFHNSGNAVVCKSINFLFKSGIKDIMTGYRAFSYLFVKSFPVLSNGFEIETEMTIHAVDKKMLIHNIIVDYRDRPRGSVSKLNTFSDGIRVLITIMNLYKNYRPFAFFSFISLILFLTGLAMLIPIIILFFEIHEVPNFPTLIVSAFMELAAIQSFFGGMILDVLRQKNLHDFEIRLHEVKENLRHHKSK